jgi:methyl-accepting chemotaxis protein
MRRLADLKLRTKLAVIGFIFSVPIVWLLVVTAQSLWRTSAATELERKGVEYLHPLGRLIAGLHEHKFLAHLELSGKKRVEQERALAAAAVDDETRQLVAVDQRLGSSLSFDEAALSKRQRSGATAADVSRLWSDLKQSLPKLTPETSDDAHRAIINRALTIARHAADTSGFILDPDGDSFYVVYTRGFHLLRLQNFLGEGIQAGYLLLEAEKPTLEQRAMLSATAARAGWDAQLAVERAHSALNEDGNFHGESATLQAKLPSAIRAFDSDVQSLLSMMSQTAAAEKPTATAEAYLAVGRRAKDATLRFSDLLDEEFYQLLRLRLVHLRWNGAATMGLTVVALAAAFTLVILMARSMTRPLATCVQSLEGLAAGDLTPRSAVGSKDEIGQMSAAVSLAVDGLRSAVGSIATEGGRVMQASQALSAASLQMSANAEETSSQAGTVSAAAEEVSKSIQSISTATREMNSSIREVAKQATDAAKVATTGVQVALTTNKTVAKLGDSSGEIGKVIKVITSIAEQTNLLALNATIEAARVGEAGKGFAVVANEVKELARETARASEDISRKIETIQADSRGVIGAITEISGIINQINDIQGTIASAVEEQTVTTREIGRNLSEAAAGAGEIARNIQGVADAARNTSAGSHQTRDSAKELAKSATEMTDLVARFRCS